MIVDLIVGPLMAVVTALLSLAPAWSISGGPPAVGGSANSTGLADTAQRVGHMLADFTWIIPVRDMIEIIVAFWVFSAAIAVWNLIMFIYNKVPVIGGSHS